MVRRIGVRAEDQVRRLFADPQAEESRYFAKNGYWPIMHLIVIKKDAAEREPEMPMRLMKAFESAHRIAAGYLDDPGASRLAWTKYAREREERHGRAAKGFWQLVSAYQRAAKSRSASLRHDLQCCVEHGQQSDEA